MNFPLGLNIMQFSFFFFRYLLSIICYIDLSLIRGGSVSIFLTIGFDSACRAVKNVAEWMDSYVSEDCVNLAMNMAKDAYKIYYLDRRCRKYNTRKFRF